MDERGGEHTKKRSGNKRRGNNNHNRPNIPKLVRQARRGNIYSYRMFLNIALIFCAALLIAMIYRRISPSLFTTVAPFLAGRRAQNQHELPQDNAGQLEPAENPYGQGRAKNNLPKNDGQCDQIRRRTLQGNPGPNGHAPEPTTEELCIRRLEGIDPGRIQEALGDARQAVANGDMNRFNEILHAMPHDLRDEVFEAVQGANPNININVPQHRPREQVLEENPGAEIYLEPHNQIVRPGQ